MFYIEMRHEGLKKYRRIQGSDKEVVEAKATMLEALWNELWEKKQTVEKKKRERESFLERFNNKKQIATDKTLEAQRIIGEVENILSFTLKVNDAINWEDFFPSSDYSVSGPKQPNLFEIPREPQISDSNLSPELPKLFSFLLLFFDSDKIQKLALKY